ncbi:MAG: hypothetical protein LBE12_10240 [Planctomycetaceae bacterium]|jgi:hypothetical protein|nr:hypothetical protein [Planctomycetaceae bacterium]
MTIKIVFLIVFVAYISLNSNVSANVEDTNEKFVVISKQMEENFKRIIDYKTAQVVYLVREKKPYDQNKADDTNKLLDDLDKKERESRENYIAKNGRDKLVDDETFNKHLTESRSRLFVTLTASERIYLTSYYYKEGKVRKEELLFKDVRPLTEIADLLQKEPDLIKGQISYSVNDETYLSMWATGTHPLDTRITDRREFTAAVILDRLQSEDMRVKSEIGLVRKDEPDSLQFLKFGSDFISPSNFKALEKVNKLPVSISESTKEGEKIVQCLFGKMGKNEICYEMNLYSEKNYAIQSMKLYYNNIISIDYEFLQYFEEQHNLWIPKHIVLKNRVSGEDVENAFFEVEFLSIEPLNLGIDLDDKLFEINLTQQEKVELEKTDEIDITRRFFEIPEELHQQRVSTANDFRWRVVLMVIGVIFIFLAILFRRIGAKKDK